MQLQPCKESEKTMIDSFLQVPAGLESAEREICRMNPELEAEFGQERQDDAIELSREEIGPGSSMQRPGPQRKLSLDK